VSNPLESRFPELLQLRLPRGSNAALNKLATKHHQTKSELVRQAILRMLETFDARSNASKLEA
jgi:hypothetical protein